nr:acid phosphatase [Rhodococcus rhodnii]
MIRHGETEWSRTGRHTGRTDIPLADEGRRRAAALAGPLTALRPTDPLVLTSPRERAVRTAELAGLEIARRWDALAEWDYGEFEGLTTEQIREHTPDWTVWTHPTPGGESVEHVQSRADLVWSVAHSQLPVRDVILVGHGHFSRALVARWIDAPVVEGRRFALSPGAYTVLGFEHGVPQVVQHNVSGT